MTHRRQRYQQGTVFLDRRRGIWYFKWYEGATRRTARLGTLAEIPTKTKALHIAEGHRLTANAGVPTAAPVTFEAAARAYIASDRFPQRHTTNKSYRNYLERYAIQQFGSLAIGEVKPLLVDRWLKQLTIAPKTRAHIKSVMRQVFEYAMLAELFDMRRNPMDFVRVVGATMRETDPRILTLDEWRRLIQYILREPMRTMVITAFSLGIRRSELAGLKWSDFDWNRQEVLIQRSVIANRVDAVKTKRSKAKLPLDPGLIALLQQWRALSEFPADSDWVWASPFVAGAMPYYTNAIQRDYITPAAMRAKLGPIGWHVFRHTYRAWLDDNGTPLGIQKDLMRHADIKTTANVYGAALPESMRRANSQVVGMILQ